MLKCGSVVQTGVEKEELLDVFAVVELFVLLNNVFQYSSALAARSDAPGDVTSGTSSRRRRLRSILRKLSNIPQNMQRIYMDGRKVFLILTVLLPWMCSNKSKL